MMQTARRWGKQNRVRKGYHVIQSFRPGEVTPEQAHTIGVELAQRLLGGRYEVVVATHLDRAHLHNHVVFNAVSFVDGKMYRDTFRDYYEGIRGVSDALCREHGLSIIEPSEAAVPQGQYQAQRHGRTNLRDVVRRDVDEAILILQRIRACAVSGRARKRRVLLSPILPPPRPKMCLP